MKLTTAKVLPSTLKKINQLTELLIESDPDKRPRYNYDVIDQAVTNELERLENV